MSTGICRSIGHGSPGRHFSKQETETADKPADLGYWVGYQISKAYYDKSPDKKAAIRNMLNFKDSKEFYQKSGVSF